MTQDIGLPEDLWHLSVCQRDMILFRIVGGMTQGCVSFRHSLPVKGPFLASLFIIIFWDRCLNWSYGCQYSLVVYQMRDVTRLGPAF